MRKSMKRACLFVASLLMVAAAGAQQYKVLEKSDKKAPAWYESSEADYLVASAVASDMETARQKCLESIRRQIIQAVAQNVEFSEKTLLKQTTGSGDEITEFINTYTAEGSVQAASVPFLKGISLAKVQGSYWEKQQDKKTKEITYAYAVRYPFPKAELNALVREFDRRDKEMEGKLDEIEAKMNAMQSVEEIDQTVNQLQPVLAYFFDKTRKQRAQGVLNGYRKLSTYISVEGRKSGDNAYTMWLNLQGRKITASVVPTLKSNCASQLQAVVKGQDIVVTYDNIDCLEDEENFVEATFRLQGKVLKHKFYISGHPQ